LDLGLRESATKSCIPVTRTASTPAQKVGNFLRALGVLPDRKRCRLFWEFVKKIPECIPSKNKQTELDVLKAKAHLAQEEYNRALVIFRPHRIKESLLTGSEADLCPKNEEEFTENSGKLFPPLERRKDITQRCCSVATEVFACSYRARSAAEGFAGKRAALDA
jgi:hypothetical protein